MEQHYEEPILIFLEMLKIFFPAGLEMHTTDSHVEYQATNDLMKNMKDIGADEKASILLISRVFSLFSIECEAIDKDGKQLDFGQTLDFDLSQFSTYVRSLKFLMKSNFQTIMYRMYRLGRADIKLYQEAISMQSFNKEPNNLFGYVIKVVLLAGEDSVVRKEPWRAIEGMLKPEEYKEALRRACQLWRHVMYIQKISTQLSDSGVSEKLCEQFRHANDYLIKRMRGMGETQLADSLS